MLLAYIIITASVLALGLLAFLDRYDAFFNKAQSDRRTNGPTPPAYYDAFTDRRQSAPKNKDRQVAA